MRKYFLMAIMSTFLLCSVAYADLVNNGDGTVTDTKTGLIWQRGEGSAMNWEAAVTYCENLVLPPGGYSDWRLPNRNELQSLVDYSKRDIMIDTVAFPGAMPTAYWSSTTLTDRLTQKWRVYFNLGLVDYADKSLNLYVRAVRSGQ